MKPETTVLYVNHASKISGAERCLLRILDDLDRSRFKPLLACPDGPLAEEAELRETPVFPLSFLDYQRNRSILFNRSVPNPFLAIGHAAGIGSVAWKLSRIARQYDVDLIHANTLLARVPAYVAGRIAHTPAIWHIRDILPSRIWIKVYDLLAQAGLAGIISVSNACRSQFWDQTNIWTIYDGISSEIFRYMSEEAAQTRKSFGWDDRNVVVGIFGRITSWKGHEQFVEAAISVNRRYQDTRWLVVGESWSQEEKQFEARLKTMVSRTNMTDSLIFTGFRNDINILMSTCDIVVVPSIKPDPFPNTVLEGMACSRPVVAFPVGGIPEAIENGVSGLMVEDMTGESLADAIISLIEAPLLRMELGANARKRVTEIFSPLKTQRAIERVYDLILKNET